MKFTLAGFIRRAVRRRLRADDDSASVALASLTPLRRAIFEAHCLGGKSFAEIAIDHATTVDAVERQIIAALVALDGGVGAWSASGQASSDRPTDSEDGR